MKQSTLKASLIVSAAIALASCQTSSEPPIASQPTASPKVSSSVASPTATSTTNSEASNFNSDVYLMAYPDVAKQIKDGKFKSALEHYEKVGQNSKDPKGEDIGGFFTGTEGSDTVTGFGQHPHLVGVNLEVLPGPKDTFPLRPKTLGVGEVDTLIGKVGAENEFLLGIFVNPANPKAEPFYVGKGEADYALIQNFSPTKDIIILAGQPEQYKFNPVDGKVRITTTSGDLVAIVEGVNQLKAGEVSKEFGVFTVK
jgi:hypothetical protein